jgi:rhodanese-related sulfurtransferase
MLNFLLDPYHGALAATAVISGAMLLASLARRATGEVNPTEATLLINREDALVIDVREPGEYASGFIAGSRNIPLGKLAERLSELEADKSRKVVVACAAGSRSAQAAKTLTQAGFSDVRNLAGGISAWQQAGLPLSRKGKK